MSTTGTTLRSLKIACRCLHAATTETPSISAPGTSARSLLRVKKEAMQMSMLLPLL